MKRFMFFEFIYLFCSYIPICFQFVAFVREHIWYKALLMGYSRLKLIRVCTLDDFLLVMGLYRGQNHSNPHTHNDKNIKYHWRVKHTLRKREDELSLF